VSTPKGTVSLTAEQLAGQRVIYSYVGLTPPAELVSLIRNGEVAGVVFFRDNISSTSQIRSVIAGLQKANRSSSNPVQAPLLCMVDQEGGNVRRLPGAPTLSEKRIGASSDPSASATSAGTKAGENLRSAGMNLNLAPVLDVYRKAGDFDDRYGRSYSSDPKVVSDLGADFITAQQKVGVAATAKHFPGLGAAATKENTDMLPVTLNVSLNSLRTIDELPFQAAISSGVKLVMVSWAVYPALDPSLPAGLSSKVVQDELRTRLHFQGVTITDAIDAGSLRDYGGLGARTIRAAQAGMDLFLCAPLTAQNESQGDVVRESLAAGLADGSLNAEGMQQAVERVIALRYDLTR
jgi:beta-N-acetylhexosaminidase